jgi:predicted O-methyltransferase YrrM
MKFRDLSRKIRAPFNRKQALRKLKDFHKQRRDINEIVDMALDFGTTGLYRVDSVQKRSEILKLARAVQSISPKVIVEIGTCNGGTLFIWSNLATDRVITCDLNKLKIRDELYSFFPPTDSSCSVVPLAGNSHEQSFFELVKKSLDGMEVDFLFIDGDHTEAGVESDYYMYSPLVRSGGIIAFHDILEKQPVPQNQVYHFWKRIKQSTRCEEFIDDPEQIGFGIGIIHVD